MTPPSGHTAPNDPSRDAVMYWEKHRILYNLLLTLQVALWVILTWPHFRPVFTLWSLGRLLILAAMANACYTVAYLGELSDPRSWAGKLWRRRRTVVFVAGTLLAMLIAQYWIGDEIYPDVR